MNIHVVRIAGDNEELNLVVFDVNSEEIHLVASLKVTAGCLSLHGSHESTGLSDLSIAHFVIQKSHIRGEIATDSVFLDNEHCTWLRNSDSINSSLGQLIFRLQGIFEYVMIARPRSSTQNHAEA